MTDRGRVEQLVRELHASRLDADLDRLCALFLPDAQLRILGTSDGKPIAIAANGVDEIRTWLGMLMKTFRLADYERRSLLVEQGRAAVHWRVQIRSRITGSLVATELVDFIETRDERIASQTELFVPR